MRRLYLFLVKFFAAWLGKPRRHVHTARPVTSSDTLAEVLQPGDVLLVEGTSRFSTAIKYLSQSNWSHAALYVGENALSATTGKPGHSFVEADVVEGVRSVGLDEFAGHATRICRPVGLSPTEKRTLCAYATNRLGNQYDLRNIIDLARFLVPTPPVPRRWRRRMLALGSGDPTKAICSTLIAQAFQSIRYPILPIPETHRSETPDCPGCVEEILHVRHYSLFVPGDFDASPYFSIIKPEVEAGFDPHALKWSNGAESTAQDTPKFNPQLTSK